MNVVHHNLDDYFADLARVKNENTVVRTTVHEMGRDENGGVVDVRLVSGFCEGENFYELTLGCGEVWAGDKDPEAYKTARESMRSIEEKCDSLRVYHGGGQWQQ